MKLFKVIEKKMQETKKVTALLLTSIMIFTFVYPSNFIVMGAADENSNSCTSYVDCIDCDSCNNCKNNPEARLDCVDAIYTGALQENPSYNKYEDDGFNESELQYLLLAEPCENFLTTRDNEIVDKFGNPYLIKSMALSNNVWFSTAYGQYNPFFLDGEDNNIKNQSHTSNTYKQLKEMGYNSVRFYMHLNWFNDIYQRNSDGSYLIQNGEKVINWDNEALNWIRRNVRWAEENDIKLILNMHRYQAQIWENQKNLVLPEADTEMSGAKRTMYNSGQVLGEAFGWSEYHINHNIMTEEEFFSELCDKYNLAVSKKGLFGLDSINFDLMEKGADNKYLYNEDQVLELEYRINKLGCEKYKKQFTDAWFVLAKMLKSQDAIIGYGLLNEPIPSIQFNRDISGDYLVNEESTVEQWNSLAQQAADAIRQVDNNHILFIERLQAVENRTRGIGLNETPYSIWGRIADNVEIDDSNYAYEVHTYVPYFLSHIPCSDARISGEELGNYYGSIKGSFDSGIQDLKYPNDKMIEYFDLNDGTYENVYDVPIKNNGNNINENQLPVLVGGNLDDKWQRYNSDHSIRYKIESSLDTIPNMGAIRFTVENLGGSVEGRGHVLFDNVVLKEHYTDENGVHEEVVSSVSFGMRKEVEWSNNDNVGVKYHDDQGCSLIDREELISCFPKGYPDLMDTDNKNGCFEVANCAGKNSILINIKNFSVKEGREYSVSADIKYKNELGNGDNAKACVELAFVKSDSAHVLDKNYLRRNLDDLKKIGIKEKKDAQGNIIEIVKRPVFLGECGMSTSSLVKYDFSDVGAGKTYATYKEKMHALPESNKSADWRYDPVQVEGGIQVLSDLFDIIDEDSNSSFPIGFNLHEYHSRTFGIYTNDSTSNAVFKKDMNRELVQLFLDKLPDMTTSYKTMVLENESYSILVNGQEYKYSLPMLEKTSEGFDMAPLRGVCETLGYSVVWNESDNSVTVTNPDTGFSYRVFADSSFVYVNGSVLNPIDIQKPLRYINGNIYAPAKEFFELIGLKSESALDDTQTMYYVISNRKTQLTESEINKWILNKQKINYYHGDTAMIPLRYVAENLGLTVGWDGNTEKVTVDFIDNNINKQISFAAGSTIAIIKNKQTGGEEIRNFTTAPVYNNQNGLTYVPVNDFFEFVKINKNYIIDLKQNIYIINNGKIVPMDIQ